MTGQWIRHCGAHRPSPNRDIVEAELNDSTAKLRGTVLVTSARLTLLMQFLALLTAAVLLSVVKARYVFEFGDAALGQMTSGLWGDAQGGGTVHCRDGQSAPCDVAYVNAGRPPTVLWLGNSQLHGVNRYEAGQKTAPMRLHDLLRPQGIYVVTHSIPNGTLAEFATVLNTIAYKYDVKKVVFPLVFNGLRGGGVRAAMLPLLQDPAAIERIDAAATGSYLKPIVKLANQAGATTSEHFSAIVERKLNQSLADSWPLWGERDKLRTLVSYVYHVAYHKTFGVTSQTKRTLVGLGHDAQMELLGQILDDMKARGIAVHLYIPPYRQDIGGPCIVKEYAAFKANVLKLAQSRGAEFSDIDNIVPGPEWGMVRDYLFGTDDYDFMHFTAAGHTLLADAMFKALTRRRD